MGSVDVRGKGMLEGGGLLNISVALRDRGTLQDENILINQNERRKQNSLPKKCFALYHNQVVVRPLTREIRGAAR